MCMCVCICVACVCMCMCVCVCICVYVCVCVSECVCVHVCICVCICVYVCACVCICVFMFLCQCRHAGATVCVQLEHNLLCLSSGSHCCCRWQTIWPSSFWAFSCLCLPSSCRRARIADSLTITSGFYVASGNPNSCPHTCMPSALSGEISPPSL